MLAGVALSTAVQGVYLLLVGPKTTPASDTPEMLAPNLHRMGDEGKAVGLHMTGGLAVLQRSRPLVATMAIGSTGYETFAW